MLTASTGTDDPIRRGGKPIQRLLARLTPLQGSGRAVRIARWVAFVAASWLILRPVLLTTVYADDYVNPFAQFPATHLDPVEIWRYAWRGTKGAGHINILGQLIGTSLSALWMLLMGGLGLRYSTIYAATKLIVYLLTVVAAAGFLRRCADAIGRPTSAWRARVYVGLALFTTLQIHIPWSNDPVSSYPASGFAAAAFGFLVLTLALEALRRDSLKRGVICGVIGGLAVIYYEISVAAVAAIVPLALWSWLDRRGRLPRALVATSKIAGPMLVIPVLIAVATKFALGPSGSTYSGTEVAVGGAQLRSIGNGLISTLPGSAWSVARDFLAAPIAVRLTPIAILAVLAVAVAALSRLHPAPDHSGAISSRLGFVLLLASPAAYLLGATVIQTSTQKVQDEAPRIGFVYNYYAIGATAVAVVLVLVLIAAPSRWWTGVTKAVAVAAAGAFVGVQFLINWNVAVRFNELTYPSRQLLVTFSEQPPEIIRCSGIQGWTLGLWPASYEDAMLAGLQDAYEYFHGEPFCTGFVRPN